MTSRYRLTKHTPGLHIRRGIPADPYVIGELPTYEAFQVGEGDIVLDLGANIGAMAHRFLRDGAEHVICVEPFPDNAEMVKTNLSEFTAARWELIEAAVVGKNTGDTVVLFTPDTNFGMVSRVHHNVHYAELTGEIVVPTVQFSGLLDKYRPTAIKCDIEGGEMDFKDELCDLPEHVTRLAIEFHAFEPDIAQMYEDYQEIDESLTTTSGFDVIATANQMLQDQHSSELRIYAR